MNAALHRIILEEEKYRITLYEDGTANFFARRGRGCAGPRTFPHRWVKDNELTDWGYRFLTKLRGTGYRTQNKAELLAMMERWEAKQESPLVPEPGKHYHAPLQDENGKTYELKVNLGHDTPAGAENDRPARICKHCRTMYIERSVFNEIADRTAEKARRETAKTKHVRRATVGVRKAKEALEAAQSNLDALRQPLVF